MALGDAVDGVVRVRCRRDRRLLLVPDPLRDLVPELVHRRVGVVGHALHPAFDSVHVLALVDALARVQGGEGLQRAFGMGVRAEPMSAAMTDETPLESSPPDRETPTGTSAIMWRRMTRSNSSANAAAYSLSGRDEENSGLTSGSQYLATVRPSAETVM